MSIFIWMLKGEDGGSFGYDEKLGSSSFHKGLPCGMLIIGGKDDDEPKETKIFFCFVDSFSSFLVVFSILG